MMGLLQGHSSGDTECILEIFLGESNKMVLNERVKRLRAKNQGRGKLKKVTVEAQVTDRTR